MTASIKLEERILNQDKRIDQLEAELQICKNVSKLLAENCEANQIKSDENEQYSRRTCLRINGIKVSDDRNKENVMDVIKECYDDVGLPFNPDEIDRAHRIGKVHTNSETEDKTQSIIVKFKSWGSRTTFYKSRPKAFVDGKEKPRRFSVSLNLTKRRYDILKRAKGIISGYPGVNFVFAVVNCSLAVRFKDDSYYHFNDETQLTRYLDNRKNVEYAVNVDDACLKIYCVLILCLR